MCRHSPGSPAPGFGWGNAATIVSLLVGVMLLVVLVRHEAHTDQPIMPLELFHRRTRSGAYGGRFLYLGAMIGFFFFTTWFTQGVTGFTPLQAGLAFAPMTSIGIGDVRSELAGAASGLLNTRTHWGHPWAWRSW